MLYKTTFLESWGSGIKRIIDACQENHVVEPKWSINCGFVSVTFIRPLTDPMKELVGLQKELSTPQVPPKYPSSLYFSVCYEWRFLADFCNNEEIGAKRQKKF